MSVELAVAVDAWKRVRRAEKAQEKREQELRLALKNLPSDELSEFVRLTTED